MLKNLIPAGKHIEANTILKCTVCGMKYFFYGSAIPVEKCEYCNGKDASSRKTFTPFRKARAKVNRNPRIIKRN